MDFIKKTLNQVNVQENTLYDIICNLFFFAKLQESEDNIKNNRVCTLEEFRKHIDESEAKYANNIIKWCNMCDYRYTYFAENKIQIYFLRFMKKNYLDL